MERTPLAPLARRTLGALAAASLAAAGACKDPVGVGGTGEVAIHFRVSSSSSAGLAAADAPAPVPSRVAGPPLQIAGTNGTLTVEEILVVIDEVELHRADASCDDGGRSSGSSGTGSSGDGGDADDDCGELEAPARFLDLPLDGRPIAAVTAEVPAGVYKRLDFEIEDLEDDETDPVRAAAIAAVRAQLLAIAPDWPRKASARVRGSFTPAGGSPIAFRVFLEAEVEIELDLIPNLVVSEDGSVSREITVDVRPDIWFRRPDGSVLPLHLHDFGRTGRLLELEVEMKNGFAEVELD